jgi:hypothetical protein
MNITDFSPAKAELFKLLEAYSLPSLLTKQGFQQEEISTGFTPKGKPTACAHYKRGNISATIELERFAGTTSPIIQLSNTCGTDKSTTLQLSALGIKPADFLRLGELAQKLEFLSKNLPLKKAGFSSPQPGTPLLPS